MKKSALYSGVVLSVLVSLALIYSSFLGQETADAQSASQSPSSVSAPTVPQPVGAAAITQPPEHPEIAIGEQSPIEPLEGYKDGVWNDGKAVFSDWMLLDFFWHSIDRRGYRPKQPITFSHQLHVEKNKMECQYCHSGVGKSPYATLPAVDTCMGCHKSIKTESPEIKKLAGYYERKESIPWVKVYNLPEHAHFTHKRHIKAGIGCQNCHGQMGKQPVVEKVSSLKMGFCISCHREKGASIDCSVCHY